MTTELLELALVTARFAGDVIHSHYRRVDEVKLKGKGSSLTLADQAAYSAIMSLLGYSGIPVVSEEGDDFFMDARRCWLVDPLDGTKDFIAVNDEFTVNTALVDGGRPVIGVVFAPAFRELYAGQSGVDCWCEKTGNCFDCQPAGKTAACQMAVSRFHNHPEVNVFVAANGIGNSVAIGSALNYGRMATAEAGVFPRLVGSSEWDTAAGQALLEGAGARVAHWASNLLRKAPAP